ncbi:hypothetical protein CK203_030229 [Vitis vinifera]|uniref:Disease resistance protein n=1 Tax=Vitis vinifera TaxID=29760 RepID=A0A438I5I1_VITVI|nr:hypothetical protein CK203_030229 [Vitis vinifera]
MMLQVATGLVTFMNKFVITDTPLPYKMIMIENSWQRDTEVVEELSVLLPQEPEALTGFRHLTEKSGVPLLVLWVLEQLEEWNVEKGALQVLRELEVRSCRRLKTLPEELGQRIFLKAEFNRLDVVRKQWLSPPFLYPVFLSFVLCISG